MAAEKIDALELGITSKTTTESIDKLIESLSKLSKELDKLQSKKVNVSITETGTASKNAASGVDRLSNSFLTQTIRITALIAVARKLGSVIQSSIANSATYIKSLNMFTVSLGDYADSATKYGQAVSDALGIDIAGWQETQGVFSTMMKGVGIVGDQAAYMSQNLTQLAYDWSSFYGITVEEAASKIKSGLAGRTQPVRKLGFAVDQTEAVDYLKNPAHYGKQTFAINQETGAIEANSSAITDNTEKIVGNYNQLDTATKYKARYNLLVEQSSHIQGNFARSLNDPYNQLRIFKEQLNQTSRSFGNMFIPALNKVMPYLNAFVQLLGEAFQSLANLFGFELPDMKDRTSVNTKDYDHVVKATGNAAKNAKKMKDYMLGIDELNVFNPNTGATGGSGKKNNNSDLSKLKLQGYDFLEKAIENSLKEAKKKIKQFFEDVKTDALGTAGEIGSGFWERVFGSPDDMAKRAKANGKTVGEEFRDEFLYVMGLPGSSLVEKAFGSPDDLAKRADEAGMTVGEQFAVEVGDTFLRGLEGIFILLPEKINEWVGGALLKGGEGFGKALGEGGSWLTEAIFGSPDDLAKRAQEAGNTVADQFFGEINLKLMKLFDNPAMKFLYKVTMGRDFDTDYNDLKKEMAKKGTPNKQEQKSAFNAARQAATTKFDLENAGVTKEKAISAWNSTPNFGYVSADQAKKMADSWKKAGSESVKAFSSGQKEATYEAKQSGNEIFTSTYNGLNQDGTAKQKFGYVSADMAKAYYENLATKQALTATKAEAKKLPKAAVSGASSENGMGKGFYKTGEQSGQGYVLGIEAPRNIKKYKEASKTMGTNTLDALKKFLNIKSPSRATMEIGDYTAQGFALGIENNAYLSKNAARNMASSALSAISNASDLSNKVVLNGTLADPTATGRVSMPTVNSGYGVGVANEGAMASLASSIYQAVVSGMSNATATAGSGGDIKVVIDGKEVFKAVQAESRKRGANISNGAFSR